MDERSSQLPPPAGSAATLHQPTAGTGLPTLPDPFDDTQKPEPRVTTEVMEAHRAQNPTPTDEFWAAGDGPIPWTTSSTPNRPGSSRRGLMLTIAVVCLVALGVGAFFVFGGGGPETDGTPVDDGDVEDVLEPTPVDGGAYSFAAATTTVESSPGLRMTMKVRSPKGDVDMTALVDRRGRRMSMVISGSIATQPGQPQVGEIRAIMDEPAAMMYVSGDVVGAAAPWIAIDMSAFGDVMGSTEWFTDPAELTDLFIGTDPVEVGVESISDEEMKRYQITLSVEEILAMDPSALEGFGTADASQLDAITFDVWVDEQSRLRRMAFDVEAAGQGAVVDIRLDHIDEPVAIPLPDPDDVMSIEQFMISGAGELGG